MNTHPMPIGIQVSFVFMECTRSIIRPHRHGSLSQQIVIFSVCMIFLVSWHSTRSSTQNYMENPIINHMSSLKPRNHVAIPGQRSSRSRP